jgi:hypothetical protein
MIPATFMRRSETRASREYKNQYRAKGPWVAAAVGFRQKVPDPAGTTGAQISAIVHRTGCESRLPVRCLVGQMSLEAKLLGITLQSDPGFSWRPGIGDPSWGGWLTVALYLLAALSFGVVAAGMRQRQAHAGSEVRIWAVLAILFAVLGVNKQLDIQTAFTEIGRIVAKEQGWYAERGAVQTLFVIGVGVLALVTALVVLYWSISAPVATRIALFGAVCVVGYVVIRAASFHHMDRFIGQRVLGLRWNWVLEMGGITLAWCGGLLRARQVARLPRPSVRVVAVQQRVRN